MTGESTQVSLQIPFRCKYCAIFLLPNHAPRCADLKGGHPVLHAIAARQAFYRLANALATYKVL